MSKCPHNDVIYTENWVKDNPIPKIYGVKCVRCGIPLPEYQKVLQDRWKNNTIAPIIFLKQPSDTHAEKEG